MNPMKPNPPAKPRETETSGKTESSPAKPNPIVIPDRSRERSTHAPFSSTQSTGWTLVFEDDFDVDNLADAASPWVPPWGGTHGYELQYYTRYDKNFWTACANKGGQNHVYQGSSINLVAKSEPGSYDVGGNCIPFAFTSAMLSLKQKFLYGHFEIRCKIPFNGQKLFPAFWLWDGDGPAYREIDIFEFEDPSTPNRLLMHIHIAQALDFGRIQDPNDHYQRNHYAADLILDWLDITGDFHTYAVRWLPNSVSWLVDGVPVRTLAGHSPAFDMNLLINLAIADWRPPPSPTDLPASFEIDYVKIYQSTGLEFLWIWGNNGANQIALWNMSTDDKFVVGDFDGDGKSELVAFSSNGWVHLMRWDGANWQWIWGNNGANEIALWMMKPDDKFVVGDFDGDGKSELVAFSSNGWVHLMKWDGANWQWIWGNNGANQIALWMMTPDDKFVVGDFDGDGNSELVAFSTNGWVHLMKWDGANWQWIWGNNGANQIAAWNMSTDDQFVVGDFDGDGKSELVAFSTTGWVQLMRWDGANWQTVWGNNSPNRIYAYGWNMKPDDKFLVGDFDGDGRSELLAISSDGWAQLMKWDGADWQYFWGNDGGETIHLWFMKASDRFLVGSFEGAAAQLLAASVNGWVHLMKFAPLP
jgi:beta-glucanase (GH16 family)